MKLNRILTFIAIATLGFVALAQPNASLSINDEQRQQTISVTVISDDIVRVDVVPDVWKGERLPSLALEQSLNEGKAKVTRNNYGNDADVITTSTGLRVVLDKHLKSVQVSCGNNYFTTDLCDRTLHGSLRLLHNGKESFYGAGERGYSFNLCGDTLINYNKQNYGYVSGEKRIKQMGITMPFIISSKGYGIFFDDFCKSSLRIGEEGIEYNSISPQPISYYVIDGHGKVENVVKEFTWLVGRQELPHCGHWDISLQNMDTTISVRARE